MSANPNWRRSGFGRFALAAGSLRFAIPVMVLVAIAMGIGAWLDSALGAATAARFVYGTGWFIGLMGLVALSLIASVITRYPWKRRHVGFITVHAGLLILIAGGFWSLFTRVEGRITLREGATAGEIEFNTPRLELVEQFGNEFRVVASVADDENLSGPVRLGAVRVSVLDRWENTREVADVSDDGPAPFRAFKVSLGTSEEGGAWIGETARTGSPGAIGGLAITVLGAEQEWTPPAPNAPSDTARYMLVRGADRHPLVGEGEEVFPGWTIASLRRFESAISTTDGLIENDSGGEANPALEVLITDSAGTIERHTAFVRFPDMSLKRRTQGDADSRAELRAVTSGQEILTLFGDAPEILVGYVNAAGKADQARHDGGLPWTFSVGSRVVTISQQASHARASTRFVLTPLSSGDPRPALLVQVGEAAPAPLPWKSMLPVSRAGAEMFVRYGPGRSPLPFAIRLEEFHRRDYPGSSTPMSYASDITVISNDGTEERATVSMNNPLSRSDWKVYQADFIGDDTSIFSVMKDPGLPVIYVGCVVLCTGILLTFYGGSLSRGHPGVTQRVKPEGDSR